MLSKYEEPFGHGIVFKPKMGGNTFGASLRDVFVL